MKQKKKLKKNKELKRKIPQISLWRKKWKEYLKQKEEEEYKCFRSKN